MLFCNGAWLPVDEKDPVMLGAGRAYQSAKFEAALPFCRYARTAIDVGAHCGLWTTQIAQYFLRVEAFEPLEIHHPFWMKNAGWKKTNNLHKVALGAGPGSVGINIVEGETGKSHVSGDGDIEVRTLDSYEFEDVDFIKIDVEGYEYHVISGAMETLKKWRPVVIVEQKPGHAGRYNLGDLSAVALLELLGAKVRKEIVGDYIMSWD